jgi:hypothetical protein
MTPFIKVMLALAALASAAGGFTGLSLAMSRHWEGLHGRGSAPTAVQLRWLRLLGIAGLLVSLLTCLLVWGSAQGWVAWAGMLTAAALSLALTLTYAARAVLRVGYAAAGLTLATLLAAMLA